MSFSDDFQELTGNRPFPWQEALYQRFMSGRPDNIPSSCNLPTGLGKTSVVVIWLIALANRPELTPRRLVYVVNRRTVVDQTTIEVETIRQRLGNLPALKELRQRLVDLCALSVEENQDGPISISTLRGQFADNRRWSADPARPSVIVGTVDMIGSRLLFGGYGVGFKSRPSHAGLLGQDALLVHDEAHLEPAFQKLLMAMKSEQERCGDRRRLRVMELSATTRDNSGDEKPFTLTLDDHKNRTVLARIKAKKRITLHALDDEKQTSESVAALALEHLDSEASILVFVRKVEDVEKVVVLLRKKTPNVEQLTGTLRGFERDQLATSNPVFARFLPESNRSKGVVPTKGTVYLVCTSAGEVGVNISADHMVSDLSTFESMAQRFGRVNRFGASSNTRIDIAYPTGLPSEEDVAAEKLKEKSKQNSLIFVGNARRRTLDLLQTLNGDGSPKALGDLDADARLAAFSPSPTILAVSDILFDAWSLTTIRDRLPGRPPVADWLHGVAEWEPPETHIAWREEVELLSNLFTEKQLEDLLDDYPLKPQELLRDRTSRVFGHLETLANREPDLDAWVIEPDGAIRVLPLAKLVEKDKQKKPIEDLGGCTVLLPPSAGGLSPSGMLDGDSETANDIADKWLDENGQPRRVRVWGDDTPPAGIKWRLVRSVDTNSSSDDDAEKEEPVTPRRIWKWFVNPKSADDDGSRSSVEPQRLDSHLERAKTMAKRLVTALKLQEPEATAVEIAAGWHDLGKDRALWQASIGNREYAKGVVLAKSGGKMSPLDLNSYRHEFGSLLDVQRDNRAELDAQPDEIRDLILHLIAAHHGRARPHFPDHEAFDPQHPESAWSDLAMEVPRRFARLQRRYGRWGLAWLESLVRAADALASQDTPEAKT